MKRRALNGGSWREGDARPSLARIFTNHLILVRGMEEEEEEDGMTDFR